MKSHRPILLFLFLASLFLLAAGADTGMPNGEQTRLIFKSGENLAALTPVLKQLRDEVYASYRADDTALVGKENYRRPAADTVDVVWDGKTKALPKTVLDAARSGLLQSKICDEPVTLKAITGMRPDRLDFNPHYFVYGGVYLYTCAALLKASSLLGLFAINGDITHYFTHPEDIRMIFMLPKLWGSFVGSLGVFAMFLAGRTFFSKRAGLIAAALYAVSPTIVNDSHAFKPYVFALPLMLMALHFSGKLRADPSRKNYAFAGIFSGLSVGSLYITGFIVPVTIAMHLASLRERGKRIFSVKNHVPLLLSIAAAIAAFLVFNPYWIIAFPEPFQDFFQRHGVHHAFSFSVLLNYIFVLIPESTGYLTFYLVLAGGVLYALWKRTLTDLLFLLCPLVYLAPTFMIYPDNYHYPMLTLPFYFLLGARFVDAALSSSLKTVRGLAAPIFAAVLAVTFLQSVYFDLVFLKGSDFENKVGAWINASVPAGSSIGFREFPQFSHGGYPPFAICDYSIRVLSGPEPVALPDYYIARIRYNVPEDTPLLRTHYSELQRFTLDIGLLDTLFRRQHPINRSIDGIVVYKKSTFKNGGNI